jgi:hypothetical protein
MGDLGRPLAREEFARFTPRRGLPARIDISGIAVEFEGLPEDLAGTMRGRYSPYIGPATGAGSPLRIQVMEAALDYFISPGFTWQPEIYRALTAFDGRIFCLTSYRLAAWFDLRSRAGQVALARGELDPASRAIENFLRSAVAWLAIDSGGFFLHGASIVRDGSAYVFFGPSGAGKSTLAAASRSGDVISDDLTLVLRRPEGLRAAGGPFRGTYTAGAPVVGLFPAAGFYRLQKDDRTLVRAGDPACFADLLGNLPWIVDQLPRHLYLIDRVRALVIDASFRYLHFRKDEDFWPAIDADRDAGRSPFT